MRRLANIILAFREYLVFVLLIVVSLVFLASNDNKQIRFIRSYAVGLVGLMQDAISIIPNVMELKRENEILRQLNVNLSDEVSRLREARLENLRLRTMLALQERSPLKLVTADVVGKSLHLLRNTITLDVGEANGVKVDMPIVSEAGLVGRIIATSGHYSIGQLMLNKDFRASAKIQRSRIDGIIAWDGGETLQLKNVAKTQDVRVGDVVTTSDYSNIFPPGIRIGLVLHVTDHPGDLFKDVEIAPSVSFATLEQAFVVTAASDTERTALEKKTSSEK
jgi:rod shape-determining protein MreC